MNALDLLREVTGTTEPVAPHAVWDEFGERLVSKFQEIVVLDTVYTDGLVLSTRLLFGHPDRHDGRVTLALRPGKTGYELFASKSHSSRGKILGRYPNAAAGRQGLTAWLTRVSEIHRAARQAWNLEELGLRGHLIVSL